MAKQKQQLLGEKVFFDTKVISPDLSLVQKESWQWFLDYGLKAALEFFFPIDDYTGKNWQLQLKGIRIGEPTTTSLEAQKKGLTYEAPVMIEAWLLNKRTGHEEKEEVFLTNLPAMTSEGTFVINGIERVVVNQLIRSPGVYFTGEEDKATGKVLYQAEIRPLRGSWLEFLVGRKEVIFARVDKKRKFPATVLLRALGISNDKELVERLSDFIIPTIEADSTKTSEEAAIEFYRRLRPNEPIVLENAWQTLEERFFNLRTYELGQPGRYKINRRLGLTFSDDDSRNWVLKKEDVLETIKVLIGFQKGQRDDVDDIDHLANRRLRRVGEIISDLVLRPALARFERAVKEKMSLVSPKEKARPDQMVSSQAIVSGLNNFFRTNQLSAIIDQTNPLSELEVLRKVTVTGPGGLTRENASFSIRDIHSSQYGKICPIRSPEGQNIGLVTYLALYTQVDKYGFLRAPFRKLKKIKNGRETRVKITDEIVYLDAWDEEKNYITHLGVGIDKNGYLTDKVVPARYKGGFVEIPIGKLDLIDYSLDEALGLSAALIPFVNHNEANRALMGANMQCQATPLINPEAPLVGTGLEEAAAVGMNRTIRANYSGKVVYVDGRKIVVEVGKSDLKSLRSKNFIKSESVEVDKNREIYHLTKFKRTDPNGTCYSQRPVVSVGDRVKKGDILADGPSTCAGELSLGRNLLIAYGFYDGLGFEDAIVVSDRLVKEDLLTSVHINEYEAQVVETKLGPEELTRDIPNVGEDDLSALDKDGIVVIGAEVGPNDILVGKIAPKSERELTAEERLLRAIFGEKAREVKDTSLRVPHGEGGIVIDSYILDKHNMREMPSGVEKIVKIRVAQLRKIKEGDKVAGRHGNKGVISRIVSSYDMPYLEDGTPVDIIISPLSVISRMNMGQILEMHWGWAGKILGQKIRVPSFKHIPEELLIKALKTARLPIDGKTVLYDGRSGKKYDQKIAVGMAYIIKLHHMVDDKIHARSTGPYSLITQQPLGGKARMGGQRMGEMEVWALEAHKAAYSLQEMLTIKSDDIEGRTKAFQAIIKGMPIPAATLPESFKVLVRELAGLALSVYPVDAVVKSREDFRIERKKLEPEKDLDGEDRGYGGGEEENAT